MKPRNFPGRKERRRALAYWRIHRKYPEGYIDWPKDIRIRIGKTKRENA
jgi:hypothetical protein